MQEIILNKYLLQAKQNLQFESSVYVESSNVKSGSQFNVDGSLKLRQNKMLQNSGFNNEFAVNIFIKIHKSFW